MSLNTDGCAYIWFIFFNQAVNESTNVRDFGPIHRCNVDVVTGEIHVEFINLVVHRVSLILAAPFGWEVADSTQVEMEFNAVIGLASIQEETRAGITSCPARILA